MRNVLQWVIDADGVEVMSIDGKYTFQDKVEQWVADNDYEIPTEPYRTMYTYNPKDPANTLRTVMVWLETMLELTPTIITTTVEPYTPTPPKQSRGTIN